MTLLAADGSQAVRLYAIVPPTALKRDGCEDVDRIERDAYLEILSRLRAGTFDVTHCNALHPLPLAEAGGLSAPMVAVLHTPPFQPLDAAVMASGSTVTYVAAEDEGWLIGLVIDVKAQTTPGR